MCYQVVIRPEIALVVRPNRRRYDGTPNTNKSTTRYLMAADNQAEFQADVQLK
jgi:hypothetical protein